MNLKEAFRYQSLIDDIFSRVVMQLRTVSAFYTETRTHKRSAENNEAADMFEVVDNGVQYDALQLASFAELLISEKRELTQAIERAKAFAEVDLDADTACNKMRRSLTDSVSHLAKSKMKNCTARATAYKFNLEGNQMPYSYEVEVSHTENFPRREIRNFAKELGTLADTVSANIDRFIVNATVDFKPAIELGYDSELDDALELFAAYQSEKAAE